MMNATTPERAVHHLEAECLANNEEPMMNATTPRVLAGSPAIVDRLTTKNQ